MIAQSEHVIAVAIAALSRGGREPFTLLATGEKSVRRAFFDAVEEGFGEEVAHAILVFADVLEEDRRSPNAAAALRRTVDAFEEEEECTLKLERETLDLR